MAPLLNTALGAYWGGQRIRRIYKGSTPMIPGWVNYMANPNLETPGGAIRTIRTNAVNNPSFETNITGWQSAASSTLLRINTDSHGGSWCLQVTTTAATSGCSAVVASVATAANPVATTVSAWVKAPAGATVSFRADEYTPPSTVVGSTTAVYTGTGNWERLSVVRPAVVVGNVVRPVILLAAPGVFLVDEVLVEYNGGAVPGAYFDGSTAAAGDFTYAWSGTAHGSTSLQRAATGLAGVGAYFSVTAWRSVTEFENGSSSAAFMKQTSQSGAGFIIPASAIAPAPPTGAVATAIARVKSAPGTDIRLAIRTAAGGGPNTVSTVATGAWQTLTTNYTQPVSAVIAGCQVYTQTNAVPVYLDRLFFTVGATVWPDGFRDGSSPGWGWDGTVENSMQSGWN